MTVRAGTALCVVALHALSKSGGSVLTRLLVRGKHLSSLTVFSQASPCGPLAQNRLSFPLSTIIMVTIVTNGGQRLELPIIHVEQGPGNS